MPNSERGGSSEQHAKAGEQGHKNTSGSGSKESGPKGPLAAVRTSRLCHVNLHWHGKSARPSSGSKESGSEGSTRGGSHEQHVKAGQQSHKNS